jgi:hypothetical protein
MAAIVATSSGAMCTNCPDVQQAVHDPHGTSDSAPVRMESSIMPSHVVKSPASRSAAPSDAFGRVMAQSRVGGAGQGEHLVERHPGPVGDLGVDPDGVDDRPSTSDSRAHTRCGRSIRFIVEQ